MSELEITLTYNGTDRKAFIEFNFIGGCAGNVSGIPDTCYEPINDEFELEALEIKFKNGWLNKTNSIGYFRDEIHEQLMRELRNNHG